MVSGTRYLGQLYRAFIFEKVVPVGRVRVDPTFALLGPVYMVSGTRDNPPLSYPGRANFSLIYLKNSTNRLHEDREPVSGERQLRSASCLTSAGRVTLAGVNTLAHIPGATWRGEFHAMPIF